MNCLNPLRFAVGPICALEYGVCVRERFLRYCLKTLGCRTHCRSEKVIVIWSNGNTSPLPVAYTNLGLLFWMHLHGLEMVAKYVRMNANCCDLMTSRLCSKQGPLQLPFLLFLFLFTCKILPWTPTLLIWLWLLSLRNLVSLVSLKIDAVDIQRALLWGKTAGNNVFALPASWPSLNLRQYSSEWLCWGHGPPWGQSQLRWFEDGHLCWHSVRPATATTSALVSGGPGGLLRNAFGRTSWQ